MEIKTKYSPGDCVKFTCGVKLDQLEIGIIRHLEVYQDLSVKYHISFGREGLDYFNLDESRIVSKLIEVKDE